MVGDMINDLADAQINRPFRKMHMHRYEDVRLVFWIISIDDCEKSFTQNLYLSIFISSTNPAAFSAIHTVLYNLL